MFINLTNHRLDTWSERQLEAARKWGEIEEKPFPSVDPKLGSEEIGKMAKELVFQVLALISGKKDEAHAILCQGDFTMTYALVRSFKEEFKSRGMRVPVLAACSEREVEEVLEEGGSLRKIVKFNFVQFREYV